MNEQINKLALQARKHADSLLGKKLPDMVWQDEYNQKFTELIVRECCSKLVEMGESWHEFAKNPPDGQAHNASGALFAAYRLKEDAVDEIQKHFGVE